MENFKQAGLQNQQIPSVGEWVITFIIMAIPLVNLIMLCVWAFGSNTAPAKANFAKAALIMMVVGIVLTILSWGAIAAMFAAAF